jgi:hypothetical protein
MNLKFICHEGFEIAAEICQRIQEYLPNLIHETEVIRTDVFTGTLYTWEVLPAVERTTDPDWENDIVLVESDGELYLADLEVPGPTHVLDPLILKEDGTTRPTSGRPKLGVHYVPINMPQELRGNGEYWAKLGLEGILWYLGVPKQHDENCFFHPKEYGKATVEDHQKDFCPKCQKFMLQLKAPLDFDRLYTRVEEIYELKLKSKRRRKWI